MHGTVALAENGQTAAAGYSVTHKNGQSAKGSHGMTGQDRKTEGAPYEEEGVSLEMSEALQEMYRRQAEQLRESGKASGEACVDIGKVMEIARRISRGDQVPARDEKKLMEYSSDLYQMAKSAAMLRAKKKRRKHKSLYKDEEKGSIEEKIRSLNREEGGAQESPAPAQSEGAGGDDGPAQEGIL